MSVSQQNLNAGGGADFGSTRWSIVLLAGQSHSPESADALEKLCRAYWYPLYAFVRRQGYRDAEAQDLTQEFFSRLLDKRLIRAAEPTRGKFRSFLLAAVKNFLSNEWDRTQTQKRGGAHTHFSLDAQDAEERYLHEPSHDVTPERIFEQRWAQTVLEQALAQLRQEYASKRKETRFETLKPFLTREPEAASYAEIALELGMTESGIKSAVHRLRQHFREMVRAEIAETVGSAGEVDEEIRHLFAVLSS